MQKAVFGKKGEVKIEGTRNGYHIDAVAPKSATYIFLCSRNQKFVLSLILKVLKPSVDNRVVVQFPVGKVGALRSLHKNYSDVN